MDKPSIVTGNMSCDDRGYVSFINDFNPAKYKRQYVVKNHRKGFIRAWHGHRKEGKAVMCLQGAAKIVTASLDKANPPLEAFIITSNIPSVVIIPPGYYNGAMTLTEDCILMYFSDKTVEEARDDDIRQPYDQFGTEIWEVTPR